MRELQSIKTMKVKEIDRTAHVGWSPADQFPILLATGTAAQQLDATFSTSSSLEIYGLNLMEPGLDMTCKGSLAIDNRFHKLCWGGFGKTDNRDEVAGVIVGGSDGGKLVVYSPQKIVTGDSDAVVFQSEKHTGPVKALDFNPFQANLLASGAGDSEIYIWDMNNLSSPMTPGAKSQPVDEVTSIAWNFQVQHILASTFATRCVVWDLRKNEPIIKVSSSTSRMRCKVVAWHPEVATQMCLASEDDNTPFIQLWDLRFATSPLKTMDNQQRGVLSLAWCPQDPDLLLSGGKDHRIICWNPNSNLPGGEIVCEIPTSNQWSYDVAWCPRNPGLISSCSYDGHVSIFSLMGSQQQVRPSSKVAEAFLGVGANMDNLEVTQPANDSKVVLKNPPKWLKRPTASKQGSFSSKILISQVVEDLDVNREAKQLEEVLVNGNYSEFCSAKIGLSTETTERDMWSFIEAKFDPDPKSKYLSLLGHPKLLSSDGTETQRTRSPEEVFDHISHHAGVVDDTQFVIPNGEDLSGQVSRCILGDQLDEAVELCLKNDLITEAILLGVAAGGGLLIRAQEAYFKKNNSNPLAKLIFAIVHRDWDRVVSTCQLESWREALAGCLVYNNYSDFASLCEKLGDRLFAEGGQDRISDAALCYIIAGQVGKVVDCWWNSTTNHANPAVLQRLAEQAIILKQAVAQVNTAKGSDILAKSLCDYANFIASQGNLSTALIYAHAAAKEERENSSLLVYRLQKALGVGGQVASPWASSCQTSAKQAQSATFDQTLPNASVANRQRPRFDSTSSAENVPRSNVRGLQRYNTTQTASPNVYNASSQPSTAPFYPAPYQPTEQSAPQFGYGGSLATNAPTGAPPPPSHFDRNFFAGSNFQPQQLPPVATSAPQQLHYSPQPDFSHPPQSHPQPIPDVPQYSLQDLKPGWNDPPPMLSNQTTMKQDFSGHLAPITHPLYGNDAPQMPEISMPSQYHSVPSTYEGYQQQQFQPSFPQKPVSVAKPPEPVKELEPIPNEHLILKDVFEELKISCLSNTTNMQIKRKLDDVSKKLEVLYNKLRENSLSPNTIHSLHQIVLFIQQRDYMSALAFHSQVVATVAFTEISGFMPGIKVLIQTAQQANVFLR
ncbi:Protein transport protein Sec31A [Chamberlinius hualienensis]